MKKDDIYLRHMMDAVSKIEKYTKNITDSKFRRNSMLQDAVIRQIEVIGVASKKVSDIIKREYSSIPWKDIGGMRDKLIHDYFGVDITAVGKTVKNDIPQLKRELRTIMSAAQ